MVRLPKAIVLILLLASWGFCADVVKICTHSSPSPETTAAQLSARFYGLSLAEVSVENGGGMSGALRALRDKHLIAAIITSRALPLLNKKAVLQALRRGRERPVPLLIEGVTPATPQAVVMSWSGGALTGSAGPLETGPDAAYQFSGLRSVTKQLTGQQIPVEVTRAYWLRLSNRGTAKQIITLRLKGVEVPFFAMTTISDHEIFFLSELEPVPKLVNSTNDPLPEFCRLAPLLLFLRYAGGERIWHAPMPLADLVIDDAWLINPYGNLDYARLLREMDSHNFHTTIAFIPWNFHRSRPEVVSLLREHPERFSICVHGNNHDHQEFYDYTRDTLTNQAADIRQAIARMERFTALTGIPHEKVMTWPHEVIPPPATLDLLKRYNFLANVNANPVPLGSAAPTDPLFALRPASLFYANFLTIKRYPTQTLHLHAKIAVNAFLGNPMIFYNHEVFFARGVGAFNGIADYINNIDPDTKWRGPGFIACHQYLLRLGDNGNYHVRALSPHVDIENPTGSARTYLVEEPGAFSEPIRSVTVDGKPGPYRRVGNTLLLTVIVQPGKASKVQTNYENDLNVCAVDIEKTSLRVTLLRYASDFRDLVLSRFATGRAVIGAYYAHNWPEMLLGPALLLSAGAALALSRARRKRRRLGRGPVARESGPPA